MDEYCDTANLYIMDVDSCAGQMFENYYDRI